MAEHTAENSREAESLRSDLVSTRMPVAFAPVVVAPTNNNGKTLEDILRRIAASGIPLIVVNDGSADDTAKILADWRLQNPDRVTVLTHDKNKGKAAALMTGFEAACAAGFTHAVTIDTDGQLSPEQIPDLLRIAQGNPYALVIGKRDDRKSDYPSRSRLGRRLSNLLIRMESGVRVQDSQCGFRVYPLGLVQTVRCAAGRYAFETEIITRTGWARCPIAQTPVDCKYFPTNERVSHFRPIIDSLRALGMHARLIFRALVPWPHPHWPGAEVDASTRHGKWTPRSFRQKLWAWVNPREAWRQLRQDQVGRAELSAGLAVGAFISNLPVYPIQTLVGLYAARRLHLHPLSVVLGSQLSIPPFMPFLIGGGIGIGHLILHGTWPVWSDFDLHHHSIHEIVRRSFFEWCIGGVLLGAVFAVLTFTLSYFLFRLFAKGGTRLAATGAAAR